MANVLERSFEGALWRSRYMVLPAVLASVFAATLLMVLGVLDVALVAYKAVGVKTLEDFKDFHREAIAMIVAAVDVFLIGTVLLIFGIGLYELFVSRIEAARADPRASRILSIRNLDQLKDRLAKIIVMVLVVTYFKEAVVLRFDDVIGLVWFTVGTLVSAAALFVINWATKAGYGKDSADDAPDGGPPA